MLSLLACLTSANAVRYDIAGVTGRTWVQYSPPCSNCIHSVHFLNNHLFREAFDEGYKKCDRLFGIKYNCRWREKWVYRAFPSWLWTPGRMLVAGFGSNQLKFFTYGFSDRCDRTSYYLINDHQTHTVLFDNTKHRIGGKNCIVVSSTSTLNFSIYKSPYLGESDEVVVTNLENSQIRYTINDTFTKISDWNHMFLMYNRGSDYSTDSVGIQFTKSIEREFDATQKEQLDGVTTVDRFPEPSQVHIGMNRVVLNKSRVTTLGYQGDGKVSFIFPNTDGITYPNKVNLNSINDKFNFVSIMQDVNETMEVTFYVTKVDSDCETLDYIINGNKMHAIYNFSTIPVNRTNCLIVSSQVKMNYSFYASSNFNKEDMISFRDFEENTFSHDIVYKRFLNITEQNNIFVKIRATKKSGVFGLIKSSLYDQDMNETLPNSGYKYGFRPHVFTNVVPLPDIRVLLPGESKIMFHTSQSMIIDYIEECNYESVIVFHQASNFYNLPEFVVCDGPIYLKSVQGTNDLELTVHLGHFKGCNCEKTAAIVNGAGKSYMTNMKTGGRTELWFISSMFESNVTIFNFKNTNYSIIEAYNGFEMLDDNFVNTSEDLFTIENTKFVILKVNKEIIADCYSGVYSITPNSEITHQSNGIFGMCDSITIFGNSLLHKSIHGYNKIDMPSKSLLIIKSQSISNEKTLVRFESIISATEINGDIEKNYVDTEYIFVKSPVLPITEVSFFFTEFPRDCDTVNIITDKVGSQYYLGAEANKKHCINSMSSVEHDLILFTSDGEKHNVYDITNPTRYNNFSFVFDNFTHIKIRQNFINGKIYNFDNDPIYYENHLMMETFGEFYIANVGYNEINESHTAIIYKNEPGKKTFIQFVDGDIIYYNNTHRVNQTVNYDDIIHIKSPEKKVEFYIFEMPDDCDFYDIVGNSVGDQYLFYTNKNHYGKKYCIAALTTFESLIYTIHANIPPIIGENIRVFDSYEYGFNEVNITNEFTNITTKSLIIEYQSSEVHEIGVVGIYAISQVIPECQCVCSIEGHYHTNLPHFFDGPSPHTIVIHGVIGENEFEVKNVGMMCMYLPLIEGRSIITTFLNKHTPMFENGTRLEQMIENVRAMMLHPVSIIRKFHFFVADMDPDCDTIDNVVGQIGKEYMIVPEMSQYNKKHCILAMSPWNLTYNVSKPMYSDENDRIYVSTTFRMGDSEEVISENSFTALCIIVKIETNDISNFTHCGISAIASSSIIENSNQFINNLLHMRTHNFLFEGPSNLRTLHRSVPGFNEVNTSKTQITSINFIDVGEKINVIVFLNCSKYKLISGQALGNSMHAPEFISVYGSDKYILRYIHIVVENYDDIEFIVNAEGSQLYFNTSIDINANKVYIVAFGNNLMSYTVFDSRAPENDNTMKVYNSFVSGENAISISEYMTVFTSQCIIIEYTPRSTLYVGAAGIYDIKKVGEDTFPLESSGIIHTTFRHYLSYTSDKLIAIFPTNGQNFFSSNEKCQFLILFEVKTDVRTFALFNKISTLMSSDHGHLNEVFESPREILVKSVGDESNGSFFLVETQNECTTYDFIFYQVGKRYMIDPIISKPNNVNCILFVSHEPMVYKLTKDALSYENDRLYVSNSSDASNFVEVIDDMMIDSSNCMTVKIETDNVSNFTHCGVSSIESMSESPSSDGYVDGLFHIDTHRHLFDGPSRLRKLLIAHGGFNVINTSVAEAVSIKIPIDEEYITHVVFHMPTTFTNEPFMTDLPVWSTNPESISVLAHNKYLFEFTVAFFNRSCDYHHVIINDFVNAHYISNSNAVNGSTYCSLITGHEDMTATYYRDPRTDILNELYYYNSHSMKDQPIKIENEFTTSEDFLNNIFVYKVSSAPTYGKVGIARIVNRYISGLFGGSGYDTVSGKYEASPVAREIVSAKFGRNIIRLANNRSTTITFPSSDWSVDNLRTFAAFHNGEKFKFPGGGHIPALMKVTGSIALMSEADEDDIEFDVYEEVINEDTTYQTCINCNKKQFLYDLSITPDKKYHEIIFSSYSENNLQLHLPKLTAPNVKMYMTTSYKFDEEFDEVNQSMKLNNTRFLKLVIKINETAQGFVGVSQIRLSRPGDFIPDCFSTGIYFIYGVPHLFDGPTNYDLSRTSLTSEYAQTVVTVRPINNVVNLPANSMIVFPRLSSDSPRIFAVTDGVTSEITKRSNWFTSPTQLTFDFKTAPADGDDILKSFPMNVFDVGKYGDKCDSIIVSGGISEYSICSNFNGNSTCDMIVEKSNVCLFKVFSSKYTYSSVMTNAVEQVKLYDPQGYLHENVTSNGTIIDTYFNSFVEVPSSDEEFFIKVKTINEYNDEDSNTFIEHINKTKTENQTSASVTNYTGVIAGVTVAVVAILIIVVISIFLICKKRKEEEKSVSSSVSSSVNSSVSSSSSV